MGMMLGNQTPDQIAKRLKIDMSEEHKNILMESWQQKADDIAEDKWHCFDIPFMMVCGCKATAEKMRDLFTTYDLSKGELFQISWTR